MKNKPLQQNLDVRGIRVYGQYRFSISNTKNCVLVFIAHKKLRTALDFLN